MTPVHNITLEKLYKYINDSLKGTGIYNDCVTIEARVKLPDEDRIVGLKVIGVSFAKQELDVAQSSAMYPAKHKATIYIDCETLKDEVIPAGEANVDKGS